MTAIKGTNSYVSLEEADAYFETRITSQDWFDTDCEEKEIALITATSIIDNSSWAGRAVTETQALAWPRIASIHDPRLGRLVNFSGSETSAPTEVCKATYELAVYYIQNPTVFGEEIGLTTSTTTTPDNIRIGSIELQGLNSNSEAKTAKGLPTVLPLRIKSMYSKYLNNGGSNTWYRAN